ncbi:hypothetical protein glysoja_028720 [Glycine soja]|uniref:Uncharacterized protein n=1 Tax=Glycine soja TaxID=3848 RepID=A0A0B2NXI3_GLYSO|nr:hypothetical protein glysoja_028720 [Glycine soja]
MPSRFGDSEKAWDPPKPTYSTLHPPSTEAGRTW